MRSFECYREWVVSSVIAITFAIAMACSAPPMPDPPGQQEEGSIRSLEEVIKDLRSPFVSERRNAILECLEYGYRDCVPELRKLVRDEDPGIRSVSAVGLGEFRDISSITAIVQLKKDPEVFPENILDALHRMSNPSVGIHVLEYLESSNHTTRLLAVQALASSQARSQGSAVLKMASKNKDPDKAKTYAMALGHLGYRPAEDYLIQLLKSEEDGPTKAASILALGRIGSLKATNLLVDILAGDYPKGRENSHQALREIRDPKSFSLLLPLLGHKDREVRFYAANIIILFDKEENRVRVRDIFHAAIRDKRTDSLAPTAMVLGEWKDEPSRGSIESLLLQKESADREDLAKSLGWLGNPQSEDVLLKVLEETSGEGRYGAAWSLGFLGGERSVLILNEKAKSGDRRMALASLEALGNLKNQKSVQTLVQLSRDENLAPFAISSLSVIPGEESRLELEKMARASRIIQKKLAIEALGQRKEEASKSLLEELTRSNDPEVRKLARFALRGFEK